MNHNTSAQSLYSRFMLIKGLTKVQLTTDFNLSLVLAMLVRNIICLSGILVLSACSFMHQKKIASDVNQQTTRSEMLLAQPTNITSPSSEHEHEREREQQLQSLVSWQNTNCQPTSRDSTNNIVLQSDPVSLRFDAQTQLLVDFIHRYCSQSTKQPTLLRKELHQLKLNFQWSDNTLNYLSLLDWHLNEFSRLKEQTEKLREEMQETLSALAKVEQIQLSKNLDSTESSLKKSNPDDNNEY